MSSIMAGSSFTPFQSNFDGWNSNSLSFGNNAPAAGTASGFNFGMNVPTFQMGLQGLGALGNLWGAWQSNKLARDQLDFTKRFATANLANQTQAYNTALEDRARARAAVEGQNSQQQQDYVDRNRLPDRF